MERIGKAAAIILSLILAVGLGFSIWKERQENREILRKAAELEKELGPLEVERNRLQQELISLKKDHKDALEGDGSIVLLFTDLSEAVYTDIFPKMKGYGFTGMLAVSALQYPGQEGCMSTEQFQSLLNAGWSCCLKWDADAEPREWFKSCEEIIRITGIGEPNAVYFPADAYDSGKDSFLAGKGFGIAVHHGEEGLSLIASEAEEGLWHSGAMGWNQSGAEPMLEEAAVQGGNLVFTVGSDSQNEQYAEEAFANMLWQVNEFHKNEGLRVCSLSEAREYRKEVGEAGNQEEEGYREQRRELEAEIQELEEEMERITGAYMR